MPEFVRSIVRILGDKDSTAGTGFVVASRSARPLIITCAHVIQGQDRQQRGESPPSIAWISFQGQPTIQQAEVDPKWWRPTAAEDVAVLAVEGPLPDEVEPLPLGSVEGTTGHDFISRGYRLAQHFADGLHAEGKIQGRITFNGHPALQLLTNQIGHGMSGAPLWDPKRRRVVGMINSFWDSPRHTDAELAFAIPSTTLQSICPDLQVTDVCPYRGLAPFEEEDAALFFGREGLVEEVTDRLRRNPKFLAVVGSSGSGKSSLVQAGLLPRVRHGTLLGFDSSRVVAFRPLGEMGERLRGALKQGGISARKTKDPFEEIRRSLEKKSCARVVLFIDQFEELFAFWSPADQRIFLEHLSTLLESDLSFTLIVTIRADFYDLLLSSPLGPHLGTAQVNVQKMTDEDLKRAIKKPAELTGFEIDSGLEDLIINDLSCTDHPLPLLEFTLAQLWRHRTDGTLTIDCYRKIGRVTGAIAQWAADVYGRFTLEEKREARRILTSLVRYGEAEMPDTRSRLSLSKWLMESEKVDVARRVIKALTDSRLVVTSGKLRAATDTIEMIHDALLYEWPNLKDWIREKRSFLLWRQRLRQRVNEWEGKDRNSDELLRGTALQEANAWAAEHNCELNQSERGYVKESLEYYEREQRRWKDLYHSALAAQLAAQAHLILSQQPLHLERGLLLAIESMRLSPSLEADRALRSGLALLPKLLHTVNHKDEVYGLAFSPDGEYLAIGSHDNSARVLNVSTRRQIACVRHARRRGLGGAKGIDFVLFSPDSRYLITGGHDQTIRVWEIASGQQIACMGHDDEIRALVVSPDGTRLCSGSEDQTARVWNISTGHEVLRVSHEAYVWSVAFSPDGNLIATGGWDHTARIWNADSGKEVARVAHRDCVRKLAISPDGRLLATGSDDGTAGIWDLKGAQLQSLPHKGLVRALAFSPDSRLLATGTWGTSASLSTLDWVRGDHSAQVWNVSNGQKVASMLHADSVYNLTFSRDGKYLATASKDRTARVWETLSGREIARMPHQDEVSRVAFNPDGASFATASRDKTTRLWNVQTAREEIAYLGHPDRVSHVSFSPDGRYLLTEVRGAKYLWDSSKGWCNVVLASTLRTYGMAFTPDGRFVATLDAAALRVLELDSGRELIKTVHEGSISAIEFSHDGKYLAIRYKRSVVIRDITKGEDVLRLEHEADLSEVLAFSPNGQYLITRSSADFQVTLYVWEIPEGRKMRTIAPTWGGRSTVAFSPCGRYLTTVDENAIQVCEVISGEEVCRLLHEDTPHAVAFSIDGRHIATAGDKTARLWDPVVRGQGVGIEGTRLEHPDQVWAVAFTPDGCYLATASKDGSARVWDIAKNREIVQVDHDDRVSSVAFSPDGRYLASASWDGTCRVWSWKPEDVISRTCSRLTRNLTLQEWHQYLGQEAYHKTCRNLP